MGKSKSHMTIICFHDGINEGLGDGAAAAAFFAVPLHGLLFYHKEGVGPSCDKCGRTETATWNPPSDCLSTDSL